MEYNKRTYEKISFLAQNSRPRFAPTRSFRKRTKSKSPPIFFFRKKEAKKAAAHENKLQQFLLLKWTASRRPKVSSLN